jgi:hypothetical protein
MNTSGSRLLLSVVAAAVTLGGLCSCAVEGVGVDGAVDVGYVGGYYEPYGYDYGGWGRGYHVGPGRGGDRRGDHPGGGRPAYRGAPGGRATPSIPGGSRGGGGSRGHR